MRLSPTAPPRSENTAGRDRNAERGAHKVSADLFQGLDDVGFSLAPNAVTYWVGEAMHTTDYQDLDKTPEATADATATLAANTAHLARRLKTAPYPASP